MSTRRQGIKRPLKPNYDSSDKVSLDTTDDFEDDSHFFRIPKHQSQPDIDFKRPRGRPKTTLKSLSQKKSSSNHSKKSAEGKGNLNKGFSSSLSSQDLLAESTDPSSIKNEATHNKLRKTISSDLVILTPNSDKDSEDLVILTPNSDKDIEDDDSEFRSLEKSVCSESEKLCPTCKCIVPEPIFSEHFSACLRKFSFDGKGNSKREKEEKENTNSDGNYHKNGKGEKANISIFPCPICFKSLNTPSQRLSHMKTCGPSHGLSSEQLILACRLQEKQEEERVLLGLPSIQPHSRDEKKIEKKKSEKWSSKSKDADLELAVALSCSLAEKEKEERERGEDNLVRLGVPEIIQEDRRSYRVTVPQLTLTSLTGKNSSKNPRKKRKGLIKTVLMTRTKDERERIISEKVAALLTETRPLLRRESKPIFAKGVLKKFQDEKCSMWSISSSDLDTLLESHFVPSLRTFIQPKHLPVGGLFKHFSQVPGRLNYTLLAEESEEDEEEREIDPIDLDENAETTIVDSYCTQLALAELIGTQELNELSLDQSYLDQYENVANNVNDNFVFPVEEVTSAESRNESLRDSACIESVPVFTLDEDTRSLDGDHRSLKDNANGSTQDICSSEEQSNHSENSVCDISIVNEVVPYPNSNCSDSKTTSDMNEGLNKCLSEIDSSRTVTPVPEKSEDLKSPDCKVDNISKTTFSMCKERVSSNKSPSIENRSLHSKLVYDWSCLLANGDFSDVILFTSGYEIPCHSLVLRVRCPSMLKEVKNNVDLRQMPSKNQNIQTLEKVIDWSSVPYDSVYSFLAYLYTGVCSVESKESDIWMDVFELAIKFDCKELVKYLESIYKQFSSPEKEMNATENSQPGKDLASVKFLSQLHELESSHLVSSGKIEPADSSNFENMFEKRLTEPLIEDDELNDSNNPLSIKFHHKSISADWNETFVCPELNFSVNLHLSPKLNKNDLEVIRCDHTDKINDQLPELIDSVNIKTPDIQFSRSTSPDIFEETANFEEKSYIEPVNLTPPNIQNVNLTPPNIQLNIDLISTTEKPNASTIANNWDQRCDNNLLENDQNHLRSRKFSLSDSETRSRRRLSYEFCSQFESFNESILPPGIANKISPEKGNETNVNTYSISPDTESLRLRQSPLTEENILKDKEIVDLTLSSDNSSDSIDKLNLSGLSIEAKCDSPSKTDALENGIKEGNLLKEKDVETYCVVSASEVSTVDNPVNCDTSYLPGETSFLQDDTSYLPDFTPFNKIVGEIPTSVKSPEKPELASPPSPIHVSRKSTLQLDEITHIEMCSDINDKNRHSEDALLPTKRSTANNLLACKQITSQIHASNICHKVLASPANETPFLKGNGASNFGLSDESLLNAVHEVEEEYACSDEPKGGYHSNSTALISKNAKQQTKFCHSKTPIKEIATNSIQSITPAMRLKKRTFTVTPQPNYQSMLSPELKKQLDKYGIRKMSRKKAVSLLLHIYNQIHPIVTDSEAETSFAETPERSIAGMLTKKNCKNKENVNKLNPKRITVKRTNKKEEKATTIQKENDVPDELNSSQTSNTSLESSGVECLEETIFNDDADDDISPTQQINLETQLKNYIKCDTDLHQKMLLYEPIWANELLANLKANGIKCSMGKLIDFLDEQCVTFRLPQKERSRKRKRTSPVKSPKRLRKSKEVKSL